jgi:hypothetical protein
MGDEKNGFTNLGKKLRAAEKDLTKGLLKWRIKRGGLPPADEETLENSSERIVDEAHNIVKRHSKSVWDDLKEAKKEFLKAYRSDDKE